MLRKTYGFWVWQKIDDTVTTGMEMLAGILAASREPISQAMVGCTDSRGG